MIVIRDRHSRGRTALGWLDSRHTFLFDHYRDPENMEFGALPVINDDRVAGAGFGEHSHTDMDIISYVLEGALEHRDSLGNGSIIAPGEVQRMSAGTGITHSEFNGSATGPVHFLQIWIISEVRGIAPSYEQKPFPREELQGRLRLVADHWATDGALTIHQDIATYAGELLKGESVSHEISDGCRAWLHVARGIVRLNGDELREGDGAAIVDEPGTVIDTAHRGELLLFDLQ